MTSRVAYPGTAVTNDVLTAANVNNLPGGWIGYAEVTANQTGITTEVDLTGLSQAVTVNTSRRIRISLYIPRAASSVSADRILITIYEGATQLQSNTVTCDATSLGE